MRGRRNTSSHKHKSGGGGEGRLFDKKKEEKKTFISKSVCFPLLLFAHVYSFFPKYFIENKTYLEGFMVTELSNKSTIKFLRYIINCDLVKLQFALIDNHTNSF